MSNVKDRIKLFENKSSTPKASPPRQVRRKLSLKKNAWQTKSVDSEDNENFNGFDKESPKVIKSPYSGGNRKYNNPNTSNIPIVADEELDSLKQSSQEDKVLIEKNNVTEGKDVAAIPTTPPINLPKGVSKDIHAVKKTQNPDYSFKTNKKSPKQVFSSVKLPDHLDNIRKANSSSKKSEKKKRKKKRSKNMERMHANLGGKLKFRQQKQNNADVSSITPEKERADDAEASVGSKNSMTPSMKDFMKRLERKDSQVSSIGENVNEDVCDEKNEGPSSKENFSSKETNITGTTMVENNDGKHNLEAADETITPAIKAPQLVEEDHFDSISPRDVAKNESLTDNFSNTLAKSESLARMQDIHDDKNNLDDHSADTETKHVVDISNKEVINGQSEQHDDLVQKEANKQSTNIVLDQAQQKQINSNASPQRDDFNVDADKQHLYAEIDRLKNELESVKSARQIYEDNSEQNDINGASINVKDNLEPRPKSSREKLEERKETARKMLQKAHAAGKKKSIKCAYYNRFCLPACGKLQRSDTKGEIFARIIAQLWLHLVCAFFLIIIGVISMSTYSWAPQFYRASAGMSLLVMIFFKGITCSIVVACIYRNVDTAACMLPFYSCWYSNYEPMIIYENAWLRGITYSKLLDFLVGIWTWFAYSNANSIVGRPRTPTIDFLMTWLFFVLFLLDIWSLLLAADLSMIVKSWLEDMPKNHVRDGYTFHGQVDENSDSDSSEDESDDENNDVYISTRNDSVGDAPLNQSGGKLLKQNSARAANETPRTPLSKQDSARLWGARTERGVTRPSFVPKLALGGGKSKSSKARVSHLSGLPTFPKASKLGSDSKSTASSPSLKKDAHVKGHTKLLSHQDMDDMNSQSSVDSTQNNDLSNEWEVHYDHEGNQYYVSRYTGESVWEIPGSNVAAEADNNVSVAATTEEAFHDADYEKYYLSVNNEILPQDFEILWTKLKISSTVMLELERVPAPNAVVEHVSAKGFRVVASGVKGTQFTVYLFAKNYNEDVKFLSEVRFDSVTRHMTAVFKCRKKSKLDFFLGILCVKDLCNLP